MSYSLCKHSYALRWVCPGLLLLALCGQVYAYQYPVSIERQPRGRAVDLYVRNDGPIPINVVIELTESVNTGFAPAVIGSKFPHTVFPNQKKMVTTAVPLKMGKPARFAYRFRYAFGDPRAQPELNFTYRLPIPDNHHGVARPYTGHFVSNTTVDTNNAIEIVIPRGTSIVAIRDGVVVDGVGFKGEAPSTVDPQGSDASSPVVKPSTPIGNYVSILHSDGTWATYGWLAERSIIPSPGTQVRQGEVIAVSDANPDAFESYIVLVVNRNFFGLQIKGIPIKLSTAGDHLIDPSVYSGQVSPNLKPKYSVDSSSEPWSPSESLVPPVGLPIDWNDEHLTPTQRQLLFRQRMLEAGQVNSSVSGSRPMFFLSIAGAVLATVGTFIALAGHGPNKPAGVRGAMWAIFRGRSTPAFDSSGYAPEDSAGERGMSASEVLSAHLASQTKSADALRAADLREQAAASEQAEKEPTSIQTKLHADIDLQDAASSDAQPAHPKPLFSPDRAKFLSMLADVMPRGYLCTPEVPLALLCDSEDQRLSDLVVDFVVVDVESGEPRVAILYSPDQESRGPSLLLSQRLALAAIPTVSFDSVPTFDQLKGSLKRLIVAS